MAVLWVQHYYTLPVIFEHIGMGDEPAPRQNSVQDDNLATQRERSPHRSVPATNLSEQPVSMEFEPYPRQHFPRGHYAGSGALDMSSMAAALPEYQMRQFQQQAFPQHYQSQGVADQPLMYQYHQGAQFAGQTATNYPPSFPQQYQTPYFQGQQVRQHHNTYPQYMNNPGGPNSQQPFQNQTFIFQQPVLPAPHSASQQQQQQHQGQYSQSNGTPAYMGAYAARVATAYPVPQLRLDSSLAQHQASNFYQPPNAPAIRKTSSNSSLQTSALRGPPRKPKQSGHALWVGNLPPQTHIVDLKDHFSTDATDDIESVFLISKSNCAFVNYKTEASCAAAMTRFHDSRFQGVRLVCRLRRGSSSAATPAATLAHSVAQPSTEVLDGGPSPEDDNDEQKFVTGDAVSAEPEPEPVEKVKEKFFVVKSLTVEDLERSVHSGIWATQAHNEDALNKAYRAAENVFLIFSANKSGEYFGYARMESAIDEESAANIDYQPRQEVPDPSPADLPLTIPTLATTTAPKGRIIDDSARGTIFWEADNNHKEGEAQNADEDGENISGEGYESASPATPQAFGKPFKIKWMSTERLPFYRTRGLRNPWNANREVKIARDGTEIEPTVGRRLATMFHRPQMPAASPNAARQAQPPPGPMGGFMSPHVSAPGAMYGRSYS